MLFRDPIENPFTYRMTRIADGPLRPIVIVRLVNAHAPDKAVAMQAIVDTGADAIRIPRFMAEKTGHDYARGREVRVGGVSGEARMRRHSVRLQLYAPDADPGNLVDGDRLPWTWEGEATVCESLEIGLLGCRDFLMAWDFKLRRRAKIFHLFPSHPDTQGIVKLWLKDRVRRQRLA